MVISVFSYQGKEKSRGLLGRNGIRYLFDDEHDIFIALSRECLTNQMTRQIE